MSAGMIAPILPTWHPFPPPHHNPSQVGIVVEQAQNPTEAEIRMNSRSRSAVLHILRRESGLRFQDLEKAVHPALEWEEYPENEGWQMNCSSVKVA